MTIEILKSKIHNVTVTGANLNYMGSVTIDEELMDAAGLVEHEKVHVLNRNNGERLVTYVIRGKKGSGEICLNGPAARKDPGWRCGYHYGLCNYHSGGSPFICAPDYLSRYNYQQNYLTLE